MRVVFDWRGRYYRAKSRSSFVLGSTLRRLGHLFLPEDELPASGDLWIPPYGIAKSATCFTLSDVNADRSQPPHRSSRSMPAIFAMSTSSEGQMYRYGAE